MPKKEWTDEERKAFGEKMKKARASKASDTREKKKDEPQLDKPLTQEPEVETIAKEDLDALIRRVKELENKNFTPQPQVTARGLIGTVEKYSVDPKRYADPTERLRNLERLEQFAFKQNYELSWDVTTVQYETKDGMNIKEPKFSVKLSRIMRDDEGNATNQRYIVKKLIMHEDPQSAIVVANDNGMEVDETNEQSFLDEMRFLQIRDWLLDIFYKTQPSKKSKTNEIVVDGKLVEMYEIASDKPSAIPFSK